MINDALALATIQKDEGSFRDTIQDRFISTERTFPMYPHFPAKTKKL